MGFFGLVVLFVICLLVMTYNWWICLVVGLSFWLLLFYWLPNLLYCVGVLLVYFIDLLVWMF